MWAKQLSEKLLSRIKSFLGCQIVLGLADWVCAGVGGGVPSAGGVSIYGLTSAVRLSYLGSQVSVHLSCKSTSLGICLRSPGAFPSHTHPGCPYLPDSWSQAWALKMQCHLTKHWLAAVNLRHSPTSTVQTGSLHKGPQGGLSLGWAQCLNVVTRLAHLVLSLGMPGHTMALCTRDSRLQEPCASISSTLSFIFLKLTGNI